MFLIRSTNIPQLEVSDDPLVVGVNCYPWEMKASKSSNEQEPILPDFEKTA